MMMVWAGTALGGAPSPKASPQTPPVARKTSPASAIPTEKAVPDQPNKVEQLRRLEAAKLRLEAARRDASTPRPGEGGVAGGPPNDDCSSPSSIGNGMTAFSTVGATTDGPPSPLCNFFGDDQVNQDIWYRYSATCTGMVTVSLCGSGYDTKVAIYDGTGCPSSPPLACNDDFCGLQSQIAAPVQNGQSYLLRVGGYEDATGTGTITITCGGGGGGGNNNCAQAIAIMDGLTPFSTVGATTDGPSEPSCGFCCGDPQIGQDIWYNYTASCTGSLTVSLCGSLYDTKVALYQGTNCPVTSPPLACNDDYAPCGLDSQITANVTQGQSYKLRVGGFLGATGTGTIMITCGDIGGPANDDCEDSLSVSDGATVFSTIGATTDGPPSSLCNFFMDNQVNQDIWYHYTATCSEMLTVSLCGSGYDTKAAIYEGSSCVGNILSCNDDSCGLQSVTSAPVTQGQTYKIRIGGYGAAVGTGTMTITCGEGPPGPCDGATGDCCVPQPTPGCGNETCCEIICNCDPFCCEEAWDEFCAGEGFVPGCGAMLLCDDCGGGTPVENDLCADSLDIAEGTTTYSNVGATTDGPGLPESCNEGFGLAFGADIWYDYAPILSGEVTISLCEGTDYDARMSLYAGCACPPSNANLVACNDDGCGDPGTPPTITAMVEEGTCYKLRIGGFGSAQGPGTINIDLAGVVCPTGTITYVSPPNGVVDARQPRSPAGGPLQGITTIMTTGPGGIPSECWQLCETGTGGLTPNAVASVVEGPAGGTYTIMLARPITPGEVTTLSYLGDGSFASYIYHPANVNGDMIANPIDILRLVDYINGAATPPWGVYSTDIDRSGLTNPQDILREIDLLNGAGVLDPWNNSPVPSNDGLCP